jgi:AcrR family transcriptional regulator
VALHSSKYSNRQELRDRIVEVSMEQFSSKGIKNVTMDNISSLLGISKRTLYEIFPDKETLLVCCMELSEIKAQEYLKTVLESSKNVMEMVLHVYQHTITRFQSLNPSFLQEITKYPKAYQLYLENREASSERAYQFFQDGVNQGLFRSDVNFVIVRALIRGQFNLLLHSDIYRSYSFLEVLEAIIFTFLRGICTDKGAQILDDFIEERRNARKE